MLQLPEGKWPFGILVSRRETRYILEAFSTRLTRHSVLSRWGFFKGGGPVDLVD